MWISQKETKLQDIDFLLIPDKISIMVLSENVRQDMIVGAEFGSIIGVTLGTISIAPVIWDSTHEFVSQFPQIAQAGLILSEGFAGTVIGGVIGTIGGAGISMLAGAGARKWEAKRTSRPVI